jgi:hypothetical protein
LSDSNWQKRWHNRLDPRRAPEEFRRSAREDSQGFRKVVQSTLAVYGLLGLLTAALLSAATIGIPLLLFSQSILTHWMGADETGEVVQEHE